MEINSNTKTSADYIKKQTKEDDIKQVADNPVAETAPRIYPASDVLRAYSGVNNGQEYVSKDVLFKFLEDNGFRNTTRYEAIAVSIADNDGNIDKRTLDVLKDLKDKQIPIIVGVNIVASGKENGKINYKAVELLASTQEDNHSYYSSGGTELLRYIRGKDGKFDKKVLSTLFNNREVLNKYLSRSPETVARAIQNKNKEFDYSALAFFDESLAKGEPVRDVLNNIYYGKDTNGNFNIKNLVLHQELAKDFHEAWQLNKLKSIAGTFSADEIDKRNEFIEIAKELCRDNNFSNVLEIIEDIKSQENDKTNIAYDRESVDFIKDMLQKSYNNKDTVSLVMKRINKPVSEYTQEETEALKRMTFAAEKDDIPILLEAAYYKAGDKKGEFSASNLDKYVDIYIKNWRHNSMPIIEDLSKNLSLEEDDKALDVFHKLYTITWENKSGNSIVEERLDRRELKFILELLTLSNKNGPKRKCLEERIDGLAKLFTMRLPMSSRDAFQNFMLFQDFDVIEKLEKVNFEELGVKTGQVSQGVFQSASEEQLLKFKDYLKSYLDGKYVDDINIDLNSNNSKVVELTKGRDYDKTRLLYDFRVGEPITEIRQQKWNNRVTGTQKDFRNNTITQQRHIIERENYQEYEILDSQKIEKYDKDWNLLYTETMEKSPVENVFNIKKTYPDGSEEYISRASRDENGYELIEKNMESLDGTKTYYRYEDDPQGNRILDYKITSPDGEKLLDQSVTFEVLDDNHFVSSRNNKKYDIRYSGDVVTVKDMTNGKVAEINLENFTKSTQDKLLPILKKFPGEELFKMKELDLKSMSVDESVGNAAFSPKEETITSKEKYLDLAILLHEWGHGKDHMAFKEIQETINKDAELNKIYAKEREAFRKHFGNAQQDIIAYFCADYHYLGNPVVEGIAETNSLLNVQPKNNIQAVRSQYWQQYFPRTIAYLSSLLN